MTDIVLNFRLYCHRHSINDVDEDFVNDYMFEHGLFGQDIFDALLTVEL